MFLDCLVMILESIFSLKIIFEKKNVQQNLEYTFINPKNHLWCFLKKYLIHDISKNIFEKKNIFTKNTLYTINYFLIL